MLMSETCSIAKTFTFDAAHYLPEHKGKCRNLHGHTYTLQVHVVGHVDIDKPMVMDFGDLDQIVKGNILHYLDHRCLNDVDWVAFASIDEATPYGPLDTYLHPDPTSNMPTAEIMAVSIGRRVRSFLSKLGDVDVEMIALSETPTSKAMWVNPYLYPPCEIVSTEEEVTPHECGD